MHSRGNYPAISQLLRHPPAQRQLMSKNNQQYLQCLQYRQKSCYWQRFMGFGQLFGQRPQFCKLTVEYNCSKNQCLNLLRTGLYPQQRDFLLVSKICKATGRKPFQDRESAAKLQRILIQEFRKKLSFIQIQQLANKGMKTLTPISFIKSEQAREKYECGICFQVCIKPVRCRGSCGRIYCMRCVSDSRQSNDTCPLKCSSPFLVQPIADVVIPFSCPYSPSECTASILSVRAFQMHYKECHFVPPEELHQKQLQLDYKCRQGHQLQFFIGTYEEMLHSKCTYCDAVQLCRSYCRICEELYCVSCRVPPCTKESCPFGHKYNFQKIANLNFICDMCGISTSVSNGGVYDDNLCNLGICEGCFADLPQYFDPSKPRELIVNINTKCLCQAELVEINSIHKQFTCHICTRKKECPKKCPNCQKHYCLSCKLMDIQNDNTCSKDHELKLFNLTKFSPQIKLQNEYGCMRCMKVGDQYYFDQDCRVRLCALCFDYCKTVTGDKKRSIITKCDKDHVLTYIAGPEDHLCLCYNCKQQKIIKLKCMFCVVEGGQGGQEEKYYCFECRPVNLETCYYEHKLKLAKFQSSRPCHFCLAESSEFHYCRKCYFYVCKGCVASNHHHFAQLEQQLPQATGKLKKHQAAISETEVVDA